VTTCQLCTNGLDAINPSDWKLVGLSEPVACRLCTQNGKFDAWLADWKREREREQQRALLREMLAEVGAPSVAQTDKRERLGGLVVSPECYAKGYWALRDARGRTPSSAELATHLHCSTRTIRNYYKRPGYGDPPPRP
jgi:hypothetical protein